MVLLGHPDPERICTSHVERQNLTMRMMIRRLTRLTNAFSKKWENLWAALCLHFAFYNFCRVHRTIRVPPAMEAGIADRGDFRLVFAQRLCYQWDRVMMSDKEIQAALAAREIILEPFDPSKLEPASYDARVGTWAFASSSKEKINLSEKGVLIVDPGEFAVLESRERVELDDRTAGQLGLRSEYAQQGLLMLSGPQIDPSFGGILTVRVINLAPKPIALPYEAPFLTIQFFRLSSPVTKRYSGPRQGQQGISARDIQELVQTEGLTLGQIMKTLSALAKDVAELRGSVARLAWLVPLVVGVGMAVVGIVVSLKK